MPAEGCLREGRLQANLVSLREAHVSRSQQLADLKRPRVLVLALALAALVAGLLALGVPAARSADAGPAASAGTPRLKLIAAQKTIEVGKFGNGPVYFDSGIWIASLGGAFQLDVKRVSYTKPLTVTQIIKNSAGTTTRRRDLPARILSGWNGAVPLPEDQHPAQGQGCGKRQSHVLPWQLFALSH